MSQSKQTSIPLTIRLVQQALQQTGVCTLPIQGQSMEPTLRPGDIVRVRHCPIEELQIGDIVAFISLGQVWVHRIIARVNGCWVTAGDNSPVIDEKPLTTDNYLGRVSFVDQQGEVSVGLEKQICTAFSHFPKAQFHLKMSLVAPHASDLQPALAICHHLGVEAQGYVPSDINRLREYVAQCRMKGEKLVGVSAQARADASHLVELYARHPYLHVIMGATYGPPEVEGFLLPWTHVEQLVRLHPIGMPELQLPLEVAYLLGLLAGSHPSFGPVASDT